LERNNPKIAKRLMSKQAQDKKRKGKTKEEEKKNEQEAISATAA
jgi:hypothetical protein